MKIVGAGLAGLLAAHAWPQAEVLEAAREPHAAHHALLRFRTDAVARLTGIDFHPVTVRKGIWFGGKFVQPSIGMANLYSRKVLGGLTADRSIWSLEPVQRWIAPETLYEQLVENVGARVQWGAPFDFLAPRDEPIVSTAPLPVIARTLGLSIPQPMHRAPIRVDRWRLNNAEVYQTIYFPSPETAVYRASITGSLLIVEQIVAGQEKKSWPDWLPEILEAFGISPIDSELTAVDAVEQKYGKIVPLPDAERKALLHELTARHGIFSLGRFACWRNLLLDDVVQDIAVLRRLMRASAYDRQLHAS